MTGLGSILITDVFRADSEGTGIMISGVTGMRSTTADTAMIAEARSVITGGDLTAARIVTTGVDRTMARIADPDEGRSAGLIVDPTVDLIADLIATASVEKNKRQII
jgi:hypothetical protein